MCLSILGFVAQLLDMPPHVLQRIAYWQMKLAGGPWNWILDKDLNNLRGLGFSMAMRNPQVYCYASKFRALHGPGGLDLATCEKRWQPLTD